MDDHKKKITILTVCSLILVAMVVALAISSREDEAEESPDVNSSQKAITTICETTDYQQTCMDSLNSAGTNSSNPKDLVQIAFQAAINYINDAVKNSTALEEIQNDPRARSALEGCQELADRAINDLERSYAKFNNFDITNVDDILSELKIWLSGAITHQETCLDGFDGVDGDAGTKMREALTTAMQMTSNSLAMVAELSTFLETLGIQGFSSRRLLSDLPILGHADEFPDWFDLNRRKLLTASPQQIKPDLVVAKDGSGKYQTINEALKDIPKNNNKTFVVYIKEGIYQEKVQFNSSLKHLMIIGDGPTKTRITGNLNFIDGTSTYHTATVAVQGDDFIARDIGFENSAGPEKHQAVALRVSADRAIFYNCHMDGYQDTLYVHTYRQFYRDCVISGTIDFIFGDSAAVFQGCTMLVRRPLDNQRNIVTAQGRKDVRQPTGLVLQNCSFIADPKYYPVRNKIKSYLGRPWKQYSRTIIMESFLDDLIQPEGWLPWNDTFALDTLFYTEFNNRGPAAPKTQRVKWPGVRELPPTRIHRFTAAEFLDGNRWIPPTQVPYAAGFIFPVPKEDPNVHYSPVVPEETKDLGPKIDKSSFGSSSSKNKSTPIATPPPPPPIAIETPPPAIPVSVIAAPPSNSPQLDIAAAAPPVTSPSGSSDITAASPSGNSDIAAASPVTSSPSGISDITAASPVTSSPSGSSDIAAASPSGSSDIAAASPSGSSDIAASSPALSPASGSSDIAAASLAVSPASGSSDIAAAAPAGTFQSGSPVSMPESDISASPLPSPGGSSDTAAPPPASFSDNLASIAKSHINNIFGGHLV